MSRYEVELSSDGDLRLAAEVARRHYPDDLLVALRRGEELWLLPTRGPTAGGLLLKQRNARGDRSVLVREVLGTPPAPGPRPAFWDEHAGALRVALGGGP